MRRWEEFVKMNVLVTGGLGHIGSKLIRDLASLPAVKLIRILDNLSTQRLCSLFNLPDVVRYEFVEGDIGNSKDLDYSLKEIDVVFHLAAMTDAPSTIKMPELTREINYEGTKKVVQASVNHGVKKIIYPSTTSVYGPCTGVVTEEWKNCKPASPYARYKLKGEEAVLEAAKKNLIEGTVLRFGTIYGPSVGMRFHTAVNKFVFQACMGLPLTVWEDAYEQYRPYLALSDAIRAFQLMIEPGLGNGEVYNVLTQNNTVKQLVDTIHSYVPDVKVVFTKAPILNQTSYYVSCSKIRKHGFEPQGDLRKSIKETVDLLKSFIARRHL